MPKVFTRARVAGVASVAVVGGLLGLAFGGPLARASQPRSTEAISLDYSCTSSLGSTPLAVTLTGDVPAAVSPGSSFSIDNVLGTWTIPAASVDQLLASVTTLSGTFSRFDFSASNALPNVLDLAPVTFGPVVLHHGQVATAYAPGLPESVGPFTAGNAGTVTVAPSQLEIQLPTGTLRCSAPTASGSGPSGWVVRVVAISTPVPVGAAGAFGAAAAAGAVLALRLRRRASHPPTDPIRLS